MHLIKLNTTLLVSLESDDRFKGQGQITAERCTPGLEPFFFQGQMATSILMTQTDFSLVLSVFSMLFPMISSVLTYYYSVIPNGKCVKTLGLFFPILTFGMYCLKLHGIMYISSKNQYPTSFR